MVRLPWFATAAGTLWLAAGPAGAAAAAQACTDPLPEIRQMMERPALDEITREKIDTLVQEAVQLCDEGEPEKAEIKFANALELLESDLEE